MAVKKKAPSTKRKLGSARKGKAAKPTKSETVDVKVGGQPIESLLIGNMPPIKDLLYHAQQIAGYQARAKRAQGLVTDAKNKAKEAGCDLNALSLAMGFEKMDPLELATILRQTAAVMQAKDMPIQMQLLEPKFGTVDEQAGAEGWAAGKAGRTPDTARWPEGSPGHVQYMRRWNDGTKENVTGAATGDEGESEEE